jgi:nitrogenase molybdenum-iron protein alpha/beta subunit
MSGRMGTLWTLSSIRGAAVIEYGCMGHTLYGRVFLNQAGIWEGGKLYSTHIDETDIAMGDTSRLSWTIAQVVEQDKPRIIFLLPSSVPEVIGTDLPALCRELQPDYPHVPLLPFGCGDFDTNAHRGVQEALLLLAKTLPVDMGRTEQRTYNLIGSCADLFRFHADAEEIKRIMKGAFGMEPLCVMTSDTSVEEMVSMGAAHLNLVIRREGEPCARHLQKRFGTPFVTGRGYGIAGTLDWVRRIGECSGLEPDREFLAVEEARSRLQMAPALPVLEHMLLAHREEAAILLGGHADVVQGILAYACGELKLQRGPCWCDSPDMGTEQAPYMGEAEWTQAVLGQKHGMLMASGEILEWAGRSQELQISVPDSKWRLNPYEPPLVGFRGAIHLFSLWINAFLEQENNG